MQRDRVHLIAGHILSNGRLGLRIVKLSLVLKDQLLIVGREVGLRVLSAMCELLVIGEVRLRRGCGGLGAHRPDVSAGSASDGWSEFVNHARGVDPFIRDLGRHRLFVPENVPEQIRP